jgi:hypothetical protein
VACEEVWTDEVEDFSVRTTMKKMTHKDVRQTTPEQVAWNVCHDHDETGYFQKMTAFLVGYHVDTAHVHVAHDSHAVDMDFLHVVEDDVPQAFLDEVVYSTTNAHGEGDVMNAYLHYYRVDKEASFLDDVATAFHVV